MLEKLLMRLRECGIRCIFITDAYPPEHRLKIWKQRRVKERDNMLNVMSAIDSEEDAVKVLSMQDDLTAPNLFFSTLNYLRCVNVEV